MKVEIRSNGTVHISGYVNAVERDSRVLPAGMAAGATGNFIERIRAGAFARSLHRRPDVRLMFNHERDIGGVSGKTLTLREDAIGLHADADISDPEVVAAAKSNRLTGWSFGFCGERSEWEECNNALRRRTITELDLLEVSVLTKTPAYIGTSIECRGDGSDCVECRGVEDKQELIEDKQSDRGVPEYAAYVKAIKLKEV